MKPKNKKDAHVLDGVGNIEDEDNANQIESIVDFAKGTVFKTNPDEFVKTFNAAEAVIGETKVLLEVFGGEPPDSYTKLVDMLFTSNITKCENTVLGIYSKMKDNPLKAKRQLRDIINTSSETGVWARVHPLIQSITDEFVGASAKKAAKAE